MCAVLIILIYCNLFLTSGRGDGTAQVHIIFMISFFSRAIIRFSSREI